MISRVYKTDFNRLVWFPFPLYIQNMSNCCRHKGNLSISRIFSNLIFGGFFSNLYQLRATAACRHRAPLDRAVLAWRGVGAAGEILGPSKNWHQSR